MRAELRWGHLALLIFSSALKQRDVDLREFVDLVHVYLGTTILPFAFGGALYDLFKPKQKPPEEFEFTPFNLRDGG